MAMGLAGNYSPVLQQAPSRSPRRTTGLTSFECPGLLDVGSGAHLPPPAAGLRFSLGWIAAMALPASSARCPLLSSCNLHDEGFKTGSGVLCFSDPP
ncbi:hypothetical protein PR202_ga28508 [Eleusine coracana subsp. coracana]|uniref:Uncharacterized protein n=1 Tax=Eleusine coracana subsp. coracana TaxID=191504 RepID=A0AAV5DJE1_ELECO|nr:hypothetical protein PR202_ga28508 [Eleusine coracana subsp. coracana]